MGQTFRYPNLLDVSAGHVQLSTAKPGPVGAVACQDGVVGDFYRMTLPSDASGWAFVQADSIRAVGDVPEGARMAVSLFARLDGEPLGLQPRLLKGTGIDSLVIGEADSCQTVGGGVASLRMPLHAQRGAVRGAGHLRARPHVHPQGRHDGRRRPADGMRRRRAARMGASGGGGVA